MVGKDEKHEKNTNNRFDLELIAARLVVPLIFAH